MEWLNKKSKVVIATVSVISIVVMGSYLWPVSDVETMDFSKAGNIIKKPNVLDAQNGRRTVKIPDPSYKETADFQDFQVITQMYVHAMAPFKKETERWEKDLLSLRMQRERIELTKDAAEVAENESKLAGFKAKTAALTKGTYIPNSDDSIDKASDITNFDVSDKTSFNDVYNPRDLRVTFYAVANKYAQSSVTLTLGSENFDSVKTNQIVASQFLLESFDDKNYCVFIKNLATPAIKPIKICRS